MLREVNFHSNRGVTCQSVDGLIRFDGIRGLSWSPFSAQNASLRTEARVMSTKEKLRLNALGPDKY